MGTHALILLLACAGDADGDGYAAADDCDDDDAAVHPGADEACDGVDNDCDGELDVTALTWADGDGDGFGDGSIDGTAECAPSAGRVADSTDCDDADASVHPGADEACDGVDNDCDHAVDEEGGNFTDWYIDGDDDGYGTGSPTPACTAPDPGMVDNGDDCDDRNRDVHPGVIETCNDIDDDCDGDVDEKPSDALQLYADGDGDGYGDKLDGVGCSAGAGQSLVNGDCDDTDATSFPGAEEVCDKADNDCDGLTDDDDGDVVGSSTWYTDADGDGYGADGTARDSCTAKAGEVSVGGDCDDADAEVSPGARESCTLGDDDCDGLADADDPEYVANQTWYVDTDGDGYGDSATGVFTCDPDPGLVNQGGDCDESDAGVNPAATEVCGGADEDCDHLVDAADPSVDPASAYVVYDDDDGDGFGGGAGTTTCDPGDGTTIGGDCDETDPLVNPGADEVCGGGDEDCDTLVDSDDDSLVGGTLYYRDRDGDAFGDDDEERSACSDPGAGWSSVGGDCDDTDVDAWSGCTEPVFTESYDVIVVGTGPAGIAAALTAREMGATVLLLDKSEDAGNGILAGQAMFAAGTSQQVAAGIVDTVEAAEDEWIDITGTDGHVESVMNYIEASGSVVDWLDSYGVETTSVELRDDVGTVARSHVFDAQNDDNTPKLIPDFDGELRTQIEVTGPVMWEDQIVGVRWVDLATGDSGMSGAKAVVMATGGYQRDLDFLKAAAPGVTSRNFVYEAILEADGGGLGFFDLLGAGYFNVDESSVGIYSHGLVDPYGAGDYEGLIWYAASEAIVVGEDGLRFADETDLVSFVFYRQWPEDSDVYAIMDGSLESFTSFSRPFYNRAGPKSETYKAEDLLGVSDDIYMGASVAELADAVGMDGENLAAEIDAWNDAVDASAVDSWGRDATDGWKIEGPDYWAVRLAPGVAKMFGGIATDVDAEVLDEDGVAIPGLYAAGEVAGMLPGGGGGGGFGGSVGGCYYGGRIAGQEAATWAASH